MDSLLKRLEEEGKISLLTQEDLDAIRASLGIHEPGHITVTLDFIPVEERVPDGRRNVYILEKWADVAWSGYYKPERKQWITFDCFGERDDHADVTHWAEIPKLRGA